MSSQTVTLRIVGDNGSLVATVRASKAEIASLGSTSASAGQQAAGGARGIDAVGAAAERTHRKAGMLAGTLGQLKGLIGGYLGAQGLQALGRTADLYADITGKLSMVTKGEQELAQAKAETFRIAQQTYQSLDATTTLYARSAAALKQYGASQATVSQLTETINRGLLVSRATTAESASAILQLSQAMGAGALRGEEFNAVNEAAPRLMELLAESLGKPRGELKKLAEDGKLTVDVLMKAFTGANAAKLEAEAAKVPLTIGRAWQQAKNELVKYIGEADQANGASAVIAQGIASIGKHLPMIAATLLTVTKLTAAWFVMFRAIPSVVAGLVAVRNAYMGMVLAQQLGIRTGGMFFASFTSGAGQAVSALNMVKIAGGLLFAAFTGWQIGKYLREQFVQVELAGIALVDGLLKGWEYIKQGALIAWAAIKAGFAGAINGMRNMLAGFVQGYASLSQVIPDFMGGAAVTEKLNGMAAALRTTKSAGDEFAATVASINAKADANRAQIGAINGELADQAIARHQAKDAANAHGAASAAEAISIGKVGEKAKKTKDDLKRLAEARKAFAIENLRMQAQMDGPEAMARFERDDGKREAREALAKNEASYKDVIERERLLAEQYRITTDELKKRADVTGAVRREMAQEVQLAGLSAQARRVEETVLRAVADAQREAIAQKKPEIELTQQQIAGLRAEVAAQDALIQAREEQARVLQDLQAVGTGAFNTLAQAVGNFVGRGFKGVKDLWKSIKDVFKRGVADVVTIMLNATFQRPLQNWLQQITSGMGGGLSGFLPEQGPQGAGVLGSIFSAAISKMTGFFGNLFGRGGDAVKAIGGAVESGWMSAASSSGWVGSGAGIVPGAAAQYGGMPSGMGRLAAMSPWLAGGFGALAGFGMGGDTLGKIGGGLAGGVAGLGLLKAYGAYSTAAAGGAGLGSALMTGIKAIPVAGWVAMGAMAINAITGGKLFGTKAKRESTTEQFDIGSAGATASASETTVRQRSFFRGREWKTNDLPVSAEAQAAVNELYDTLRKTITDASQKLGVAVPDIVGGSFRREFDAQGKLTREFGTIAGKVYNEAQEAFAERLVGENLLSVAKMAGAAAELETLAEKYRDTGKHLQSFASFALAVQSDIKSATGLWRNSGDGILTAIVTHIEGLAKAGESLADAYARFQQAATDYGSLMGGVRTQLATRGLNAYQKAQLDVELGYRQQVKQANELAKAMGLQYARAEDLAAIEQLRALSMADLADQYRAQQKQQNDHWLQDLDLSNLSPLRDDQKLSKVMDMLRESSAAGDAKRSQNLAEQALKIGRDMMASGQDYNDLYAQVKALVGSIQPQTVEELQGLTNDHLQLLADMLDTLPQDIASEMAKLAVNAPAGTVPALPPAPTPAPPPPSGGGGGGGGGGYYDGEYPRCVAYSMLLDDGSRAGNASVGDEHGTHDPIEGFARTEIVAVGRPVNQPCVRLVTYRGAALICSRTTPFTHVDAPADVPEHTTLAPHMLGRQVLVRHGDMVVIDVVVQVEDAGIRPVAPIDFGGRSFAAGENADALIYSHNIQKAGSYASSDISALVVAMDRVATTNEEMLRIERGRVLDDIGGDYRSAYR